MFSGIEYGAEAYFIFEQNIDDARLVDQTYGKIQDAVNSIPNVDVSDNGVVQLNNDLRQMVEEIQVSQCRIYFNVLAGVTE